MIAIGIGEAILDRAGACKRQRGGLELLPCSIHRDLDNAVHIVGCCLDAGRHWFFVVFGWYRNPSALNRLRREYSAGSSKRIWSMRPGQHARSLSLRASSTTASSTAPRLIPDRPRRP